MKRKFLFTLTAILLVSAMVFACVALSACDNAEEQPEVPTYDIKWNVPENVTVKVDDAAELPASAKKDTKIVFAVTAPAGYSVTVKSNNSTLTASSGKYTINVARAITVDISLEKAVASIAIKTQPEKLGGYYNGDPVDTTGMVVEVTYEAGDKEDVTSGWTINPEGFVGDETSYTVNYKGKSATVTLTEPVAVRAFGFTSVRLELGKKTVTNEDGTTEEVDVPYYVLTGTYSHYDESKFGEVGFDFQEQGYYSESQGGSQGWTYILYDMSITEFEGGVYTLRVDMSKLTELLADPVWSMLFNPHMGFNTPGDNQNPNVEVEDANMEEGQTITWGKYTFRLHKQATGEGENVSTTWGMAAVYVTDTENYVATAQETPEEPAEEVAIVEE